ncbi:hypothetical protein ABFS82_14G109000 [Erythranthe guttata]
MLKQRTAWELKKKPAEQRLMDLTNQKKKNGDSVSTDRPYKRSFGLRSSAMNRAQTIQANLSPHFPSFAKPMQISHVARKFELTLPKLFCDAHLPKKDGMIVFLDENDQSYNINYVVRVRDRFDLTGGWRSFSTAHALLEGDVLVFQLIEPCKFKVYIVKDTRLTKSMVQIEIVFTVSRSRQNQKKKIQTPLRELEINISSAYHRRRRQIERLLFVSLLEMKMLPTVTASVQKDPWNILLLVLKTLKISAFT